MLATVGEAHPTVSVADSMSAQRERVLLEAMLRHQVGIEPYAAGAVLDLVAVGMVNSAWRNSPVEDWHAQGRLRDGDMLRINAYSTWRVRQIIRRWRVEVGLTARSRVDALDAIRVDDTDRLAARIWRWLVNPSRQLPTGTTLADLAGDDLSEYGEHADGTLGGFAATAERHGALCVLAGGRARRSGLPPLVGYTNVAAAGGSVPSRPGPSRRPALGKGRNPQEAAAS
jgi:hypothetical protein